MPAVQLHLLHRRANSERRTYSRRLNPYRRSGCRRIFRREAVEYHDIGLSLGVVFCRQVERGYHLCVARNQRSQQFGLRRIHGHAQRLADGQLDHRAIVLRKRVAPAIRRTNSRFHQSRRFRVEGESRLRFSARFERDRLASRCSARERQQQFHLARFKAIVAKADVSFPGVVGRRRRGSDPPHSQLAYAHIFARRRNRQHPKIRRRRQLRILPRNAASAREYNLAGLLRLQFLRLLCELQRLFQIQCRRARLRAANRVADRLAVRFKCSDRGRERIGSHQHQPIRGRQRVHVRQRHAFRLVQQNPLARARAHPCGCVQQQHVIPRAAGVAKMRTRDGQQQQENAQDLQQQTPRLMHATLMFQFVGNLTCRPESERGHYLAPLRAVEQVQRHQACRNDSGESQEFAQAEVEKIHCCYCNAPDFTKGPNNASSTGIEVVNPTYRPPLRSATPRIC